MTSNVDVRIRMVYQESQDAAPNLEDSGAPVTSTHRMGLKYNSFVIPGATI